MSREGLPSGGEEMPRYLDALAQANHQEIKKFMDFYVSSYNVDLGEPFGEDAERIAWLGSTLIYRMGLTSVLPSDEKSAQRSLRFGIMLGRQLTDSLHTTAGLDTLERIIDDKDTMRITVNNSYLRYLHHHIYLKNILRDNTVALAPRNTSVAKDIVSFMLHETELAIVCEQETCDLDVELQKFLGN